MITLLFILVLLVRLNFCSHGYTLFFSETFSVLRGCFNDPNYYYFKLDFYHSPIWFYFLNFSETPSLILLFIKKTKLFNNPNLCWCLHLVTHSEKSSNSWNFFCAIAPALIYYCLQFKVINHVFKTWKELKI